MVYSETVQAPPPLFQTGFFVNPAFFRVDTDPAFSKQIGRMHLTSVYGIYTTTTTTKAVRTRVVLAHSHQLRHERGQEAGRVRADPVQHHCEIGGDRIIGEKRRDIYRDMSERLKGGR